ncbi:hypothetical protein Tco_0965322 [Tanacetum coccineum]
MKETRMTSLALPDTWNVPYGGDDATMEQIRKKAKCDNDDYVCRDSLEAKYMADDVSSKKFLVSNFTNYKMTNSRPVLEQYNELLGILGRFTQHKINMDEAIRVSCIINKLPASWKDFKHTLKHLKEELTLVELGSHLCIEESLRVRDSDKPKCNNVAGPSVVNMVVHNNSSRYNDNKSKHKHHDNTRVDPNKKADKCTDKLKNHKKAVKNEQARTREPKEYKAEARKAKPQSKSAKRTSTMSHQRNATLAILDCAQFDPTSHNIDQTIEGNERQRLYEREMSSRG